MKLTCSQSNSEGSINIFHFLSREGANVISKQRFVETYQSVAKDGTVVFQPFIYACFNMGRKTCILGIHRGTDYCGERSIDGRLPGYNQIYPLFLRVMRQTPAYQVEVSALHRG